MAVYFGTVWLFFFGASPIANHSNEVHYEFNRIFIFIGRKSEILHIHLKNSIEELRSMECARIANEI